MSDNGNEPKAREILLRATSRAGLTEDDPLYAIVAAQAELLQNLIPAMIGEGAQISSPQFTALKAILEKQAASIKALPGRDDLLSKADLQALAKQLAQTIEKQVVEAPTQSAPVSGLSWRQWMLVGGVAAIIAMGSFLAGRYIDAQNQVLEARQANSAFASGGMHHILTRDFLMEPAAGRTKADVAARA